MRRRRKRVKIMFNFDIYGQGGVQLSRPVARRCVSQCVSQCVAVALWQITEESRCAESR